MSEMAAVAFSSCLSGTSEPIILLNKPSSLVKKKLMKTTEKSPTPTLEIIDAADPSKDEKIDTSNRLCNSLKMLVSILKSCPRAGNDPLRNSLKLASGTEICVAAFSILAIEIPFAMLPIIGTIMVAIVSIPPISKNRAISADNQSGICLPRTFIFLNRVVIGRAIRDVTTAARMYTRTSLRYQQMAAIKQNTAAYSVYFASFSVYFSLSIAKCFCCAIGWHIVHISLHQETKLTIKSEEL